MIKTNKTTRTSPFKIQIQQKINIQYSPDLYKMVKRWINRFHKIKEIIFRFKITGAMDFAYSLMFLIILHTGKTLVTAGFFINIQKLYCLVIILNILIDKELSIIFLPEPLKWNNSLILIELCFIRE